MIRTLRAQFALRAKILATVLLALSVVLLMPRAYALDPTSLEPAEVMEGKTFELEQEVSYRDFRDSEVESETSLEYEINPRSALRLSVPVEWEEDEDAEVTFGLRYKFLLNPNAGRAPLIAASIEAIVPDDGDGVDGELEFYVSKSVGNEGKHGLHLNLIGYYDDDADSDERDFQLGAVAGYSYRITPKTDLVADVAWEQLEESGEESTVAEVGVKHDINDTVALALGVGAGIGSDSPDFVAHAGISFRFGPGHS